MDRTDEFKKWIDKVEEALATTFQPKYKAPLKCNCKSWDCKICYGGEQSPLTFGEDNLDEESPTPATPDIPVTAQNPIPPASQSTSSEDNQSDADMVDQIIYMQDIGLSKLPNNISREQLVILPPDQLESIYNKVMGNVSESKDLKFFKGSLSEQMLLDEEIDNLLDEAFGKPSYADRMDRRTVPYQKDPGNRLGPRPEKSQLSRIMSKNPGGRSLINHLHKIHKLDNEADFEDTPIDVNLLWKEFKSNPNDFVIVRGTDGVAAVKPSLKHIQHMEKKPRRANQNPNYNPKTDTSLQYQVIAYKDDGQQIDPEAIKAHSERNKKEFDLKKGKKEKEDSDLQFDDPTILKGRVGILTGKDFTDNILDHLSKFIGRPISMWISGWAGRRASEDNAKDEYPADYKHPGSVNAEKIAKRAENPVWAPARDSRRTNIDNKETKGRVTIPHPQSSGSEEEKLNQIYKRIAPHMNSIANIARNRIMRNKAKSSRTGDTAGERNSLDKLEHVNDILKGEDQSKLLKIVDQAVKDASGYLPNTPGFNNYVNGLINGDRTNLKGVVNSLVSVFSQI